MRIKNLEHYSLYGYVFVLPAALYFCAVFLYPILLGLWNSFHTVNIIAGTRTFVAFQNYSRLFESTNFAKSVQITFRYLLVVVPTVTVLALLIAGTITGYRRQSFNVCSAIFFLPLVSSMVAAGMAWLWLLNPNLGLVNNLLHAININGRFLWFTSSDTALLSVEIVGVWTRFGLDVLILSTAVLGVPADLYESASIDGASEVRKFFGITIPLINPQIVMILTLETIFAVRSFGHINATTGGGPAGATKTVIVYMVKDLFHLNYGAACAVTVLVILFLFLISLVQRWLLRKEIQY